MFKFLAFFLKVPTLKNAGTDLYRGASRILLLLLHDFPDFLAEYYFSICDIIPPNCIQLRNVVLSAFPSNVVLPDPYLRISQFDSSTEMGPIPPILSDFTTILHGADIKQSLEQLLLNRGTTSLLDAVKDRLSTQEKYDLSLINSLVMYIGVSSVAQAKARNGTPLFVSSDPGVIILHYLVSAIDVEGISYFLDSHGRTAHILFCRSTSSIECNGSAPPLSKRSYPMVLIPNSSLVRRCQGRKVPRGRY